MAKDHQVIVQGGAIALSNAGPAMFTKSDETPAAEGWGGWTRGISSEAGWPINIKGQSPGDPGWPNLVHNMVIATGGQPIRLLSSDWSNVASNVVVATGGRPIRLLSSVYRSATQEHQRITSSPDVLGGKPCIKGTRVPVALVLRYLATDEDPVDDLDVSKADVQDCLKFAASISDERV